MLQIFMMFALAGLAFYAGLWLQGANNAKKDQARLSAWEDALAEYENELNARDQDVKKQLGEIRAQTREVNNKLATLAKERQDFADFRARLKDKIHIARQAEQAIERKIAGYGDEYLIPATQLIDETADEYGSREAAAKLKTHRQTMRGMIKDGTAAIGQDKAVSKILLDFYNAKTEELVARVKHDNYGKLKQELADLFALTEYHAKQADFAARINPEYHAVRQQELKWASVLHVLKMEEREEQRAIREAAREEERSRREYEKALKEAKREEALIQAAMDRARAAIALAAAEQKAQYEAELAELSAKLQEAESKNQRALSMAQQTRAGHVYLISNIGSFGDNIIKIGMTRRLEPLERVRELGDASVPFLFDVHAIIYSDDAPALEKELHRAFNHARVNKVNHRKEFFRISPAELKQKLAEMGVDAHFTLAAEAAEYRETRRIEAMGDSERGDLLDKLLAREK